MSGVRIHRRAFNCPGHAHELTFSCFHRYAFLRSDRTCRWLADAVDSARDRLHFDVWAYVFMPEHVHMIVRPREESAPIAAILDGIKRPVSRLAVAYLRRESPSWLERIAVQKAGRVRHQFWQKGGGYDRNITEPRALSSMISYVHMNPVRRGLVEQPSDFRWSSAAWYDLGEVGPLNIDPIPPEWTD